MSTDVEAVGRFAAAEFLLQTNVYVPHAVYMSVSVSTL